jgi:hypothetical protein
MLLAADSSDTIKSRNLGNVQGCTEFSPVYVQKFYYRATCSILGVLADELLHTYQRCIDTRVSGVNVG